MQSLSRRRFLSIAACAGALGARPATAQVTQWHATALGARATLSLAHPEAEAVAERVWAELRRLERIFSLYRADSAITVLNAEGILRAPPFELLDCLSLCDRIHHASGGRFDPTVQPLWAAHSRRDATGAPDRAEIARAQAFVGWSGVRFDSQTAQFERPGMALTLNGIAQGYIADRVVALLTREGLTDIMVDTGELRALGGRPDGSDWPVTLRAPDGNVLEYLGLRDLALATSAPHGTLIGENETTGHIFDPRTGQSARTGWQVISVGGPSAALADGLSTALCLMDREEMENCLSGFPGMILRHVS